MKLRYLLPFLFLLLPKESEAQTKIEGNSNTLDVKSEYFDASLNDFSLENPSDLENLANSRGELKLKFRDNSAYILRNDILDYIYGGELEIGPIDFYYNNSNQNVRNEDSEISTTPVGEIRTQTTMDTNTLSEDFGFFLNYKGSFVGYENATGKSKMEGNTLISVGEEENLVPFSLETNMESTIYSVGFENGFLKLIQNEQNGEKSERYLLNARRDFEIGETNLDLSLYYDEKFSGFLDFNFFDNLNLILNYQEESGFGFGISSSDYSDLNRRDFERNLENMLRVTPRIYDSSLETRRNYLQDMFFTNPLSYNFSIDKDEITANVNLKYFMGHYSEESIKAGLRLGPLISAYDFEQEELTFGLFFEHE